MPSDLIEERGLDTSRLRQGLLDLTTVFKDVQCVMPSDLIEERDQIVSRHRYASLLDLTTDFKDVQRVMPSDLRRRSKLYRGTATRPDADLKKHATTLGLS
jgi:hypothetical protein